MGSPTARRLRPDGRTAHEPARPNLAPYSPPRRSGCTHARRTLRPRRTVRAAVHHPGDLRRRLDHRVAGRAAHAVGLSHRVRHARSRRGSSGAARRRGAAARHQGSPTPHRQLARVARCRGDRTNRRTPGRPTCVALSRTHTRPTRPRARRHLDARAVRRLEQAIIAPAGLARPRPRDGRRAGRAHPAPALGAPAANLACSPTKWSGATQRIARTCRRIAHRHPARIARP